MLTRSLRRALTVVLAGGAPLFLGCSQNDAPVSEISASETDPIVGVSVSEAARVEPDPAPPVVSTGDPETLIERARMTFSPDEQIRLLEAALDESPRHRTALAMLLQATQTKALDLAHNNRQASIPYFVESGKVARDFLAAFRNLKSGERELAIRALYNEACSLALQDRPKEAVATLQDAIDAGFLDNVIYDDPELDPLRGRSDFQAVVASLEQKREEQRRQASQALIDQARADLERFETFPFAFELPDLEGKRVALDDFKGKVVIVDIWGTWCPPCREEVPHLIELQETYGDRGLQVIGLNYEHVSEDQIQDKIREFIEEFGINYPCLIVNGQEATIEQIPDFRGFPTTLVIDAEGTVRFKKVGFAPQVTRKVEAIVQLLLEERDAAGEQDSKSTVD